MPFQHTEPMAISILWNSTKGSIHYSNCV